MINNVGLNAQNINTQPVKPQANQAVQTNPITLNREAQTNLPTQFNNYVPQIRTKLTPDEETKFIQVVEALEASTIQDLNPSQMQISQGKKLLTLLATGKLLNSKSNDKSTMLDNLYKIITEPRFEGISGAKIANQVVDAVYNPTIITQRFGDIPNDVREAIVKNSQIYYALGTDLSTIDVNVNGSGTCPAASLEFMMANKMPAEFARWAAGLSSPNMKVPHELDYTALSKNKQEADMFMNYFKTTPLADNNGKYSLELKPDKNAILRALIQDKYYDEGERTSLDVLMQSTIMTLGTGEGYNSFNDIKTRQYEENGEIKSFDDQGLWEDEKTFIESVITNEEKTSLVYQVIDENGNLVGRKCEPERVKGHIQNALNLGQDIVIGYTDVVPTPECPQGKLFGHEITIVGIQKEADGKEYFICNDTDDEENRLVKYEVNEFLPKIHHATYPAELVEGEVDLYSSQA